MNTTISNSRTNSRPSHSPELTKPILMNNNIVKANSKSTLKYMNKIEI